MIKKFGLGIDLTSIERFKKKPFKTNQSFYKLIFSQDEIMYCLKFKNSHEKFAGKFALKEALIKSIDRKISFSEIETSYSKLKPIIKIKKSKMEYDFIASLSHESDFAIAAVISERIK